MLVSGHTLMVGDVGRTELVDSAEQAPQSPRWRSPAWALAQQTPGPNPEPNRYGYGPYMMDWSG